MGQHYQCVDWDLNSVQKASIILFFIWCYYSFVWSIRTTSHLNMSSTHNYNTRSKEISDSKILEVISMLREELVENF